MSKRQLLLLGFIILFGGGLPPALAQVSINVEINAAPPPARVEVVPPPRSGYVWAPGYWAWNGREHVWVEGRWIENRPGYVWVPDRWQQYGPRYRYEPGRWVIADERKDWKKRDKDAKKEWERERKAEEKAWKKEEKEREKGWKKDDWKKDDWKKEKDWK